jgi:hypothetical protein
VATVREAQLRLIYSFLKPVVRAAARFHVPLRTLADLLRLAYFEHLQREGLKQTDIALRFGQTDRNMRSMAKKLKSNFFEAEHEIGAVRDVENDVALHRTSTGVELLDRLSHLTAADLERALGELVAERRIEQADDGGWRVPARYHVLSSEHFHHRVDALNHYLDGMYGAVLERLIFDNRDDAMVKAISFMAKPESLRAFIARFEGDLRREVATLEEEAAFEGESKHRYTLGITLAPIASDLDR